MFTLEVIGKGLIDLADSVEKLVVVIQKVADRQKRHDLALSQIYSILNGMPQLDRDTEQKVFNLARILVGP